MFENDKELPKKAKYHKIQFIKARQTVRQPATFVCDCTRMLFYDIYFYVMRKEH